jgi:hypothetical protein
MGHTVVALFDICQLKILFIKLCYFGVYVQVFISRSSMKLTNLSP